MEVSLTPEFFDIFGFGAFVIIILISLWGLKKKNPLPNAFFWILLVIGLLGLVVDGYFVYSAFLK